MRRGSARQGRRAGVEGTLWRNLASRLPHVLACFAVVVASLMPPMPPHSDADRSDPDGASVTAETLVVVISIDGLNPTALRRLGHDRLPVLTRVMRRGASTLNARTAWELTLTLPNHTSMVTGRSVSAASAGHGVTWNDDRRSPQTVQDAAGDSVQSVFSVLHGAGYETSLFASKTKFSLWKRSWPEAIDLFMVRGDNELLTDSVRADLYDNDRALTFVHLSETDVVGHARGWLTGSYNRALMRVDRNVGRILGTIRKAGEADRTFVIITSDHGGAGKTHADATKRADYRIPFMVMGPGIPAGEDLYGLNRGAYAAPGRGRPTYSAPAQPIRNGAVANLVTGMVGLSAVPGSQINPEQDLNIFVTP